MNSKVIHSATRNIFDLHIRIFLKIFYYAIYLKKGETESVTIFRLNSKRQSSDILLE